MKTYWAIAAMAVLVSMTNFGCVGLDKYQAMERANGVLEEDLSRAKQDLLDCEQMNKQKDTMIESLNNQIATKDQMIASLTDENKSLRDSLASAQAILEKQAGQVGTVQIIKPALPEPLHKELKALADAYPDQIEYLPNKGAVRWKADLLFPLGSDQLAEQTSASMEALKKFADIVSSNVAAGFDVIVIGHTCTTPIKKAETLAEHKTNWHLSAHRAIAVMNLLASENVSESRMGVMGYGEFRPIADNSTKDGKAKNRRVEIYLVAKDSVSSMSEHKNLYQVEESGLVFARP